MKEPLLSVILRVEEGAATAAPGCFWGADQRTESDGRIVEADGQYVISLHLQEAKKETKRKH